MADQPESGDVVLSVGITEYRDPALPPLPDGEREVSTVLAAVEPLGFTCRRPLLGSVTRAAIERYVGDTTRGARRVLLYWTGHGRSDLRGDWLFTSGTTADQPDDGESLSPLAVAVLLARITDAVQIVMVLDCCGAGASALQIARAVATTRPPDPEPGRTSPTISFISATYGDGEAQPLLFAQALASALRLGPPATSWPAQKPMVSPQEVAAAADGWLRTNRAPELQKSRSIGLEAGTDFFRNPHYDPRARDALIDASSLVRRRQVLEQMLAWLAANEAGLFLLTGSVGTGKSVVFSQLLAEASLAAPARTARTWVSVNLDGLGRQDVIDALAPRVGLSPAAEPSGPEQIIEACAGRRMTLVIDSLDRAVAGDRLDIVQGILVPAAVRAGAQVLVADRGGIMADGPHDALAHLTAAAAGSFDLDADAERGRDVTRHVQRILLTTQFSPYAGDARLSLAVAGEIARRCDGIFLAADTVAYSLARAAEAVHPLDAALGEIVQAAMASIVEHDLARHHSGTDLLLELLTPLAWAAADAVPLRDVWPAMVNGLAAAGPAIDAERITGLLAEIGGYLVRRAFEGRTAYGVRHAAVGEFLRTRTPLPTETVHRRICQALRPASDAWDRADPFVLRHIAFHAERGDLLGRLLSEPDFLLYAEPEPTLAAALRMETGSRAGWIDLYLRGAALFKGVPPPMRAFVLETLACEGQARGGLPPELSFSAQAPCWVRWTTAGRPAPHVVLRAEADSLDAVAAVRTSAGTRVGVASNSGLSRPIGDDVSLEIWDPTFSVPVRHLPATKGTSKVEMLVSAPLHDQEVLIVGYTDNILEARSADSGRVLWRSDQGPFFRLAVVPAGHEHLIATAGYGPVTLSRIDTGDIVRLLPSVSGTGHHVVAPKLEGFDRLYVLTETGYLDCFDSRTGRSIRSIRLDEPWTVAVAPVVRGRPLLVGARFDGRIEVRDATDGQVLFLSLQAAGESVDSMTLLSADSEEPVVATADGALVTLWNCQGDRLGILRGHAGNIAAICTLPDPSGFDAVASVADDGTLRIWTGGSGLGSSSYDARTAKGSFRRTYPAKAGDRNLLLAEDLTAYLVIDGADGHALTSYQKSYDTGDDVLTSDPAENEVWGVTTNGEQAFALTGHSGTAQLMWGLRDGANYALPTPGVSGRGHRRTTFGPDLPKVSLWSPGRGPLLVIGGGPEPIGVFDFTGQVLRWLPCPEGSSPCFAVPSPAGDRVLVRLGEATFALYDPSLDHPVGQVTVAAPAGGVRALAATITAHGLTLVYAGHNIGTWWSSPATPARCLVDDAWTRATALVRVGSRELFALSYRNGVMLVRPEDGAVTASVPFAGVVYDLSVPEPGCLSVVAAHRIYYLELSAQLGG